MAIPQDKPEEVAIAFPHGYLKWSQLKRAVLLNKEDELFDDFGGVRRIYVNRRGLRTAEEHLRHANESKYRTRYDNGTVFVFDLFCPERKGNEGYIEGKRQLLAVMVKDSERFGDETGHWSFALFDEGKPKESLLRGTGRGCFLACHSKEKKTDYVQWRTDNPTDDYNNAGCTLKCEELGSCKLQ